jgi:hypothetical protein
VLKALPMAGRERKFAGATLQPVGVEGEFEGYASLFDVVDLGRDVVAPGAFRDSLARRGPSGVKLLWQHDPGSPIGVWREIAEDGKGLRVRGRLDLAVARAREVLALMRSGAVDGLSIGFRTERARKDAATGVRRIDRLDLWEISIVTFPMLPGARVASVKRAPGLPPSPSGRADTRLVAALRRGERLFLT